MALASTYQSITECEGILSLASVRTVTYVTAKDFKKLCREVVTPADEQALFYFASTKRFSKFMARGLYEV